MIMDPECLPVGSPRRDAILRERRLDKITRDAYAWCFTGEEGSTGLEALRAASRHAREGRVPGYMRACIHVRWNRGDHL